MHRLEQIAQADAKRYNHYINSGKRSLYIFLVQCVTLHFFQL